MAVKMNLKIITKNHVADTENGFLAKSIPNSNGYATAMPTAWEFSFKIRDIGIFIIKIRSRNKD